MRLSIALFLPLILWLLVWLGIQNGIHQISFSDNPAVFLFRARGAFPILAAFVAMVMVVAHVSRQRSGGFTFFGPLGFVTVYGLVGLAASFLSPDGSVALYWAAVYVSVPLVLWGIVWGREGLAAVHRIINLNWLIILLLIPALFITAILYLDLGTLILTPSSWFDCALYKNYQGNTWHSFTSGFLRPTGVGRYAALAAILAIGGLWSRRSRWLWVFILVASIILLLSSGARGAFLGFGVAALVVIFLHAGNHSFKKVAAWGGLCIAVLIPVVWSTGIHTQFVDSCIFRDNVPGSSKGSPEPSVLMDLPIRVTVPPGEWVLEQVSLDEPGSLGVGSSVPDKTESQGVSGNSSISNGEQTASSVFTRVLLPLRVSTEKIRPAKDQVSSDPSSRIGLTAGFWQLKPRLKQLAEKEQTLFLRIDPGLQALEQLAPGEELDPDRILKAEDIVPALFTFSGRSSVWSEGFRLFKEQPILGQGFHADRLLLGTHMHNTFMHALIQTGLVGTIPLVVALLYAWVLLIKAIRNRASLPPVHRHLIIQVAGIIVFFSFRAISESTGAFFGVDWLLLAPLLVYLQVVTHAAGAIEEPDQGTAKIKLIHWRPVVSWLRKSPST